MAGRHTVLSLPKCGHDLTADHDEHYHQAFFVAWFRRTYPDVLIFAVPNGGKRGKAAAAQMKAEGVVAGVPDLFIPAWHLWIEMKRPVKGRLSAAQKGVIGYLETCGYRCLVGFGFSDAVDQVTNFQLPPS